MQTKKKSPGRNPTIENASPRVSRSQKKASENVHVAVKKVTELITSSARKKRVAGTILKKSEEPVPATNLFNICNLVHDETSDVCLGDGAVHNASMDFKDCNEGSGHGMLETIFSPTFHISKSVGGDIANGVDFIKFFQNGDHEIENSEIDMLNCQVTQKTFETVYREEKSSSENTICPNVEVDTDGNPNLSSEVSAIYLAMKNSKLECIDEHGQDSMSTDDVCVEEDENEEYFDDFDPFLFIKNLPDLSSVVPTFRPMLLPKQTRSCPPTTLVLDLDETLVHSTLEPCGDADFTFPVNFNLKEHTVYVRCRPYLKDFLERVASLFEIIIFTASQSIYAEQLLNVLDPKRKIFRHRVYRESCVFVEGNYLKDLTVLGRDLSRVIIIDNSPQAFGFQVDNGIPIESWFDDRTDEELLMLLPFLESLVGVEDVRPLIAKKFNLQEKVAAAVYPYLNSNRGEAFER